MPVLVVRHSPASNRSLVGFLMYAFSCNAESAQASRGATLPGLKGCEKPDRKAYSLALRRKALVDWMVLVSNSSPGGQGGRQRKKEECLMKMDSGVCMWCADLPDSVSCVHVVC